jgi:hypothetical protein
MDFEDIPEAEESPVIVQQDEPYFYEENPLKQVAATEIAEQEPYYYEDPPNVANQMPPGVPEQNTWEMPEPEPDDALTYVSFNFFAAQWLCCILKNLVDISRFLTVPVFNFLNISAFNKVWNAKLDAKKLVEAEAERAVKAKAAEDMSNWTAQRDIRLHTKKVIDNFCVFQYFK